MAQVVVIGAGYVGLTTAACVSSLGHHVSCVDIDQGKIDRLNSGRVDILEEGLESLVKEGLGTGRLRFVNSVDDVIADAEYVFLCVATPPQENGSADLSYLTTAVQDIAPKLSRGAVLINKSTVPVGTARMVQQLVSRTDVSVVANPEFLREGSAVADFMRPDRIVIGTDDQAAAIKMTSLYLTVPAPVVVTDPQSAELIKYASNSFLAVKLSYINSIADISEHVGADIKDVLLGMGFDPRIGEQYLRPGPGWGGSCLPKDTRALIHTAVEADTDIPVVRAAVESNEQQISRVARVIAGHRAGPLHGLTVAAWGLAFKAGTNDVRDSPALSVLGRLTERGATVKAYDPAFTMNDLNLSGIEVEDDPYAVCSGADVLVVLTEWPELRWLDFEKVIEAMAGARVVDTRNLLDRSQLVRLGFEYWGIGRGS
ncbi:MAG: UDP-glucose/GDP-mannose dehydrogenase family protein [Acidimicrobiia bacterium]|jgi:UDPglucose 6-dehydrogenase|nr:UDP-glucose/GDP-mannose dehydrogenase family protein [Acidimicrobiia bacterium]MBP8181417.1 UDP-glucose/GDP-mannose dehydrogenase family protein [Acidimicrobiia bacterium]